MAGEIRLAWDGTAERSYNVGMVARTVITRVIARVVFLLLRWHVITCRSALSMLHYIGATWIVVAFSYNLL
jgi:hypothetical protein